MNKKKKLLLENTISIPFEQLSKDSIEIYIQDRHFKKYLNNVCEYTYCLNKKINISEIYYIVYYLLIEQMVLYKISEEYYEIYIDGTKNDLFHIFRKNDVEPDEYIILIKNYIKTYTQKFIENMDCFEKNISYKNGTFSQKLIWYGIVILLFLLVSLPIIILIFLSVFNSSHNIKNSLFASLWGIPVTAILCILNNIFINKKHNN